jgi:putative membrane protein
MKTSLIALLLAAAGTAAFAADNTALAKSDKDFFTKAAAGGMYEVEVGKLAESKAQNADVKSFGSMLVKDHSAANDELKALAQKKGVTLPTALPKKEQKELDKLGKAKNFDKDFLHEVGVEDHRKDIKLFEKTAKGAKDPDVKAFAAKTLPTLQQHLQRAEELDKAMKGKKA